ncbi:uncharacterized protein NPIL_492171, partial [Nephila pilipes]
MTKLENTAEDLKLKNEILIRLLRLELFKEFEKLNPELSGEDSEIVEFEDRYFSLKLKLQTKLDVFNVSHPITDEARAHTQNSSVVQSVQSISNFRLPKLDISEFSGKFEDWMNFKDLFVSSEHSQTSLSNSQKFQYLKAWTDSQAVLSWLSSPAPIWKPFIANRISKTLNRIPQNRWQYVPTKENPADIGSG